MIDQKRLAVTASTEKPMQDDKKWEAVALGFEQVEFDALSADEKAALLNRTSRTLCEIVSGVVTGELSTNGQRVARSDTTGTHYYFSDHLGSHGVVENATGSVCEQDIDYYPYGGVEFDYCALVPQNYKFTGKERDTESGLDNFGARYDSSALGRFMTPDWAARPVTVPYAKFGDPQTLNLYAYVENGPVNRADADGHQNKAIAWAHCEFVSITNCTGSPVAKEAQNQPKPKPAPKPKPKSQPKPQTVAVGTLDKLHPAPFTPGVQQQDVYWHAELMRGTTIVGDLPNATITLNETKGQGNDKAMQICNPCSDVGTFVDTQHVSATGLSQTVNQSFSVNNQAVGAIVIQSDGTVVAQGSTIQVTITDSGSTFTGH